MSKNIDGEKASKHILKQLDKHNIPYRVRSGSAIITCPYHPSPVFPDYNYLRLSINIKPHWYMGHYIPVGFCRCWSCGKICHFNDLIENTDNEIPKSKHALFKDLKKLPKSGSSEDTELFSKKMSFAEEEQSVFVDVSDYWKEPWHGSWRTIKEKTLLKMGASSFFDYDPDNKKQVFGVNRLLFYAYDADGNKIGWIGLSDDEARKKKWVVKQKNMPGSWVGQTLLFHEKFPNNVPILLTEGPYDALRMIQEGFNAVSMLGAGSWSEDKKLLLVGKASHVIILFDGDETGYEKSLKVYKSLKEYVPTKRLLLPIFKKKEDQIDPGNMPDKYVRIVRKKVNEFVNQS